MLEPGEVAATAGTSGVIYGISDRLNYDPQSRINSFAHVNHSEEQTRIGVLLCINGAGIFNRWIKNMVGPQNSYDSLNALAASVPAGSEGLRMLPFGNGAERMLGNRLTGAHFHQLDFNVHGAPHLVRAAQEAIAFAFRYGLDIMRANGMEPSVIRAGRTNMFLSDVFIRSFVNSTGVPVELYSGDGSTGAALGAAVGAGFFADAPSAFGGRKPIQCVQPSGNDPYETYYQEWKELLETRLRRYKGSAGITETTNYLTNP